MLRSVDDKKDNHYTTLDVGAEVEANREGRGDWFRCHISKIEEPYENNGNPIPSYAVRYIDTSVETGLLASRIRSVGGNTLVEKAKSENLIDSSTSTSTSNSDVMSLKDKIEVLEKHEQEFRGKLDLKQQIIDDLEGQIRQDHTAAIAMAISAAAEEKDIEICLIPDNANNANNADNADASIERAKKTSAELINVRKQLIEARTALDVLNKDSIKIEGTLRNEINSLKSELDRSKSGRLISLIRQIFKWILLCTLFTIIILFHVECCIRNSWVSSIIFYNITNIAYNHHTDIYSQT